MTVIDVQSGNSPLILGLPHTGTMVPDEIGATFNEVGKALADTDWHIHDLYEGLLDDVTRVRTQVHRYVIDVNRDPGGVSLYPGQNTTGLCPITDFDGRPIYLPGAEPDAAEIEDRRQRFHAPYHAALSGEIDRVLGLHGFAVLYDCHSIRSDIPFLFEGTLPDFNIGTNGTRTCAADIEAAVAGICAEAPGFSMVVNGRFKGGWTTRHYGNPDQNVHAIQMELAQSTYMQESPPWAYAPDRAASLRDHLTHILKKLQRWRPR